MNRRAALIWAALAGSLWIVMILCTHWEPVIRDGWGNVRWHRTNSVGLDAIWHLLKDGWLGSNPRLGQTLTTLLYAPGPYHVIVTPLLELALLYVMTAVILGRWPSVRRSDDALVFVTSTAVFALCTPQFGPMLFYRPFMGNYTFGLLLNLAWLVPYRFHTAAPVPGPERWGRSPLLVVLGVAAGLCNEHTGPAFLALGVAAMLWSLRGGHGIRAWMIAGLVGLAAGYVLLMIAPGHDARYGGLAKEAGILGRIADRGAAENLRILAMLAVYVAWSLPWIVLAVFARQRTHPEPLSPALRQTLWALAVAGVLATLALLGSPKLGPRLYVHSVALIAMAITGAVISQLGAAWARTACAVLSVLVLLYAEVRMVITYRIVGAVGAERLAIIQGAPPHASVVVPRFGTAANNWFLGDDFLLPNVLEATAASFDLANIELAPN